MQGADDAARDRMFVAVGVPYGDHRFAGHQVRGRAERNGRQRLPHVDLDNGQVRLRIVGHERANGPLAVGQRDQNFADALDHVMVGHNVSAAVDHHAGAHAVDAAVGFGAGGQSDRRSHGLFAADVNHGPLHALNRLDDRRLAQFRSDRRGCRHEKANQGRQAEPSKAAWRPGGRAVGSAMGCVCRGVGRTARGARLAAAAHGFTATRDHPPARTR